MLRQNQGYVGLHPCLCKNGLGRGKKINRCFGITTETMDINDILGWARACIFHCHYISMPRAFFNVQCIFNVPWILEFRMHFKIPSAFFNVAFIFQRHVHFSMPYAFFNAARIFQWSIQFSMPKARKFLMPRTFSSFRR